MQETRPGRTVETTIVAFDGSDRTTKADAVVTEEPLEIRLIAGGVTKTLAVTMRTPGNDFELAFGFITSESIIADRNAVAGISYCVDPAIDADQRYNIVNVELSTPTLPDLARFERHFTVNSSCGVCGKAQIDTLRDLGITPIEDDTRVDIETIYALPDRMRVAQRIFASTGGLHAAALFDSSGDVIAVREDIGRHNAIDKLIGWGMMNNRLPLSETMLLVSGRASYEILQKALIARIPIVAAVSAPSSLALHLANEFGVTLIGFLRTNRANAYSAPTRILRHTREYG